MMRLLGSLAVLLVFAGGCGYSAVGYSGTHRSDVRTVSVAAVANATYDTQAADALTAALVQRLEKSTPYRVAEASSADTLLEVTMTGVSRGASLRSRSTGIPEEQVWAVTADAVWKDLRTGKVLLELRNFTQTATQYPTFGEGPFIASQQAADGLAEGIVDEMSAKW